MLDFTLPGVVLLHYALQTASSNFISSTQSVTLLPVGSGLDEVVLEGVLWFY